MDRQIRTFPVAWRTAEGERLWLSTLIDAMERVSQGGGKLPELSRLRSQLACPASPHPFAGSAYSLRN
jgi:hypothetical protein